MARQRKRSVRGGGSVFQRRSDGRWAAKFKVEATGRYKTIYADKDNNTEAAALKKLEEVKFQQRQGTLAIGPQQTVKQFLEYWLEDVQRPAVRMNSYRNNKVIIHKFLIPGLGHFKLQQLTTQHIQTFYAKLQFRERVKPSRIIAIHLTLHKALRHAKKAGMVGVNVSDGVDLPQREGREKRILTEEQVHLFLQKIQGQPLEALLLLALTTGLRRGEILALRWSDINVEKGTLQVMRTLHYYTHLGFREGEPKTPSSRRKIDLPPFLIQLLKEHRLRQIEMRLKVGACWVDRDLVFPNERTGNFLHPRTLLYRFQKFLKESELPKIHFHDLRHSAATMLLTMGVPANVIQEMLGHSDIKTTLGIYVDVIPSMRRDAVNKMESFYRQRHQQNP